MGFWGSIHASILNSIAARTYAFETFRNRSNLYNFRESQPGFFYKERSLRFHGINDGADSSFAEFVAPKVPISFSNFQVTDDSAVQQTRTSREIHSRVISSEGLQLNRSERVTGVSPIWIQIGYGYCCLLYTSPSPRDKRQSRMPSSA